MQYWNEEEPCVYCGSTSNTGHVPACRNYGLFDHLGRAIKSVRISKVFKTPTPKEDKMQTTKFVRKPFIVDAIQVTADNMDEIAAWCGGHVRTMEYEEGETARYIKVHVKRALSARQTRAFETDWVLRAGTGYKVYTDSAFKKGFDPLAKDNARAQNLIISGNLIPDDPAAFPRGLVKDYIGEKMTPGEKKEYLSTIGERKIVVGDVDYEIPHTGSNIRFSQDHVEDKVQDA